MAFALCIATTPGLFAATIAIDTHTTDRIVGISQDTGTTALGYYANNTNNVVGVTGSSGSRTHHNIVFGYTLPTLAIGETLDAASFSFEIIAVRDHGTIGNLADLDIYLLDTANPDVTGDDFFLAASTDTSGNAELIGSTFPDPAPEDDTQVDYADDAYDLTFNLTGSALTLLQGYYTGNTPNQTEAFFRFNLNADTTIGNDIDRYRIDVGASESVLTLNTVPEPSTFALIGLAGLATLLRRRR